MSELDDRLARIKQFVIKQDESELKKRIFDCNLTAKYVDSLPQNLLTLGHVILHTQSTYRKPFTDIKRIKYMHDLIALNLVNHKKIDELDD